MIHKFKIMKIVINSFENQYLETISHENIDNIHQTCNKFALMKEPFKAKIFAINESISSK